MHMYVCMTYEYVRVRVRVCQCICGYVRITCGYACMCDHVAGMYVIVYVYMTRVGTSVCVCMIRVYVQVCAGVRACTWGRMREAIF